MPRRSTAAALVTALLLAAGAAAAAGLEPAVLATFAVGEGPGQIPAFAPGMVGGGVPTSFLVDEAGRLHVLVPHARTVLVVDRPGAAPRVVKLTRKDGGPLPEQAFLFDLALDRAGGYLVLDRAGGWVARFSAAGAAQGTFGAFVSGDRLEVAPDGDVSVRDRAEGVVCAFDPEGTYLGAVADPQLSPLADGQGRYARANLLGGKRACVWLRSPTAPMARLVAVLEPGRADARIVEAEPVGIDAAGRLVVVTTEVSGDHQYAARLVRISATGVVLGATDVAPNLERVSDLPRFWRVAPDGRVLTFRLAGGAFEVLAYTLPE